MIDIPSLFGSMVFNQAVMKERLPENVFQELEKTIKDGTPLNLSIANVVATVMKDWAIEKGATHFTHWFQPMIGITAEKHDSFISKYENGKIIMEFSGKELIKGEPDASSFPSGGLRATFEARGYTAWDPTSYAFIKDNTLYIPTAFCSYSGESLDKKTPLLKSCELINKQALRILKLFGNTSAKRVFPTVGAEQEYFLIDKQIYQKRKDLVYCRRTLFGAKAIKGQDLEDHYFGAIRPRVSAFMKELDQELWKLGVLAKTKHNEVAPAQHEIAPIFTSVNIATDHNNIIMQTMKTVAEKHDLICLLHEKPFAYINGSGKHNNWSLCTDTGVNLLDPGKSPYENAQFLLFLCAIIKGVDEYQDLLRVSVASAGNDHRLGANEAPVAIISVFLGNQLTEILTAFENGVKYGTPKKPNIKIGVNTIPKFPKDTTDRNRTSPFAFTNNKFEFRMVGSNFSIACPNIMLNTIVAEELCQFADILEKSKNFNKDVYNIISSTIKNHKRIIFNGNNYCEEWKKEAKRRGLSNLESFADAIPQLIDEKNIQLLLKHKVYSKNEITSRYNILLENYCRVINIEAKTMISIAQKQIFPAVLKYINILGESIIIKKEAVKNINCFAEEDILTKISALNNKLYSQINKLKTLLSKVNNQKEDLESAKFYQDEILKAMNGLRETADTLEEEIPQNLWPYPNYNDILLSV